MDTTVRPRYFHSNLTPEQRAQRRHETQEIAVGVGAAGVTAHVGTSRGTMLRNMYERIIKTSKLTAQNNEIATGIWAKLVRDTKKFGSHAFKWLKSFENTKFIGPIIKSPITKKLTGVFGGVTAVFVLISSLGEASKNGKIAVSDLKEKLDMPA